MRKLIPIASLIVITVSILAHLAFVLLWTHSQITQGSFVAYVFIGSLTIIVLAFLIKVAISPISNKLFRLWSIITLVVVIYVGMSTVYIVQANEVGVVHRFSKFVRAVPPGINFKLPYGIESVIKLHKDKVSRVDKTLRSIDVWYWNLRKQFQEAGLIGLLKFFEISYGSEEAP